MASRIKIFKVPVDGIRSHRKLEKRVNRFLKSRKSRKGTARRQYVRKPKIISYCDGDHLVVIVKYKQGWI